MREQAMRDYPMKKELTSNQVGIAFASVVILTPLFIILLIHLNNFLRPTNYFEIIWSAIILIQVLFLHKIEKNGINKIRNMYDLALFGLLVSIPMSYWLGFPIKVLEQFNTLAAFLSIIIIFLVMLGSIERSKTKKDRAKSLKKLILINLSISAVILITLVLNYLTN